MFCRLKARGVRVNYRQEQLPALTALDLLTMRFRNNHPSQKMRKFFEQKSKDQTNCHDIGQGSEGWRQVLAVNATTNAIPHKITVLMILLAQHFYILSQAKTSKMRAQKPQRQHPDPKSDAPPSHQQPTTSTCPFLALSSPIRTVVRTADMYESYALYPQSSLYGFQSLNLIIKLHASPLLPPLSPPRHNHHSPSPPSPPLPLHPPSPPPVSAPPARILRTRQDRRRQPPPITLQAGGAGAGEGCFPLQIRQKERGIECGKPVPLVPGHQGQERWDGAQDPEGGGPGVAILRSAAGGPQKADEIYGSDGIIKFITTGIRAPRARGLPQDEGPAAHEDRRGAQGPEDARPLLPAQPGHPLHPRQPQTRQAHPPRARGAGAGDHRAPQHRRLHLLLMILLLYLIPTLISTYAMRVDGSLLFDMMSEGAVKGWASSTESKIKQFVDQYLINYPQENVRRSTEKLLASLFRKGTESQRLDIIALLTERVQQLNSMGRSSKEFLSLVTNIFENFPSEGYHPQRAVLLAAVLAKTKEIFAKTVGGKEYELYSLCANMIDFGGEFKPYLLEANGCLKCFGKPEVEFETASLNSVRDELRAHLNSVEWILKRKYEISNLQVTFGKKKISYKSITIFSTEEGVRRELGKFAPNDPIPPFNLTTSAIGITFEFAKARRSHITCIVCANAEEYSTVCSACITKLVDMEGRVKVVGGNPDKINRELTDSFRNFSGLRAQLEKFAQSVQQQSKVSLMKGKIVQEMEAAYLNIIQNLRLLRDVSEPELLAERRKYESLCTDCYSCHFYEFNACIDFILNALKKGLLQPAPLQLAQLIQDFRGIFAANKVHANNEPLSFILAELFSQASSVDYFQQITLDGTNSAVVAELLLNLMQHLKREKKEESFLPLRQYVLTPEVNRHFTLLQKVQLFVVLILNEEQFYYLHQPELDQDKLQDLKRLSLEQYQEYRPLLSFNIPDIFNYNINNTFKLFLVLLPEQLIPESNLDITDPGYLRYIKTVLPVISEQTILSNVVFSPNPIIKLNLFKLLPQIVQQLPLESSIKLIQQLCKYRPLWNTYIRETVESFDRLLDEVEKERKLMVCLEGYAVSKENLYFQHIYRILTPQRPSFIIRLEIPEKEMQKEEKNKGGPVEYIYLPVREVKSEDLKGDTMGALHEWITQQIRRMNQDMAFDLIVENNIVDNLDLSLEIVYKRIVQKEAKRTIGSKTYDFFRVIYRIQGIFGEANERNCGNPRDEKLEECINFSSYLLNRLPCRATGLQVLMSVIPTLEQKGESRERRDKMIRILQLIFRNESIIRKVVEWQYGNSILSMTVKSISLQKQDLRATESLLEMCSRIIDEANKEMVRIRKNSGFSERKNSADMEVEDGEESERAVRFVLEKVKEADEKGLKDISKKLIKILPFCSKDDYSSSKYLIDYFEMAKILEIKYSQRLAWLLEFIQALSESYVSFKNICRDQGITARLIELIVAGLAASEAERSKDMMENLELCVIVLKGLMQGDVQLQDYLFEKGILQELYRVGSMGSSEEARGRLGKIPSVCFEMVKYFHEGKMISHNVAAFFQEQEERKRRAIQSQKNQRKQEIMSKKKKVMESYQHLMRNEDSDFLTCSSCKEGYSKKKEVLGVYLYSSKLEILSLDSWWKDNKKVQSVTSTSYFQPIHLECHNNAMKDDLKIQKTEWDGAVIRNSEVLCNNWCAFKGPETTDEEFDRVYRKYFEKNNKANGFWIVFNDLNGLLEKFSKEFNFAQETKGSSHTHNAKLIPVLLVLACHLMKGNDEIRYLKEGITFIEEHLTKKPNLVNLYFCLLLFHCNSSTLHSKRPFCLRLIDHLAYANFKDTKPFYVYLALVQSIMRLTHKTNTDGFEVLQHLNAYIPKNFQAVLQSLEVIAEEYKNVYLKWENQEQARKYFEA